MLEVQHSYHIYCTCELYKLILSSQDPFYVSEDPIDEKWIGNVILLIFMNLLAITKCVQVEKSLFVPVYKDFFHNFSI